MSSSATRMTDPHGSQQAQQHKPGLTSTASNLFQLAEEAPNLPLYSWYNDGQAVQTWGAKEALSQSDGVAILLLGQLASAQGTQWSSATPQDWSL